MQDLFGKVEFPLSRSIGVGPVRSSRWGWRVSVGLVDG
jgi:hypothetical protein